MVSDPRLPGGDPPRRRPHRLLFELGGGGMGSVYLAVSHGPAGFQKLKVVKRLRADLALDPQFLEMFLDEARLAARLHHPNVVQTNEVGFDGEHYFLEMEWLEGQSLDMVLRRLRAGAPTSGSFWHFGAHVLAQALAGLHYAHELVDFDGTPLRVVHRDVSPHNIFVGYDGIAKVLDFGIAKAAGSTHDTRTGVVRGKTRYMAPEQAARREVDRRADVFAVGVILWHVLVGRSLWGDLDIVDDHDVIDRLRRGEIPPSPRAVRPDVPESLDAICARALALRAEDRYATAAEMGGAIERWLETLDFTEWAGQRETAGFMCALFDEQRRAIRGRIQRALEQLEEGAGGDGGGAGIDGVPPLHSVVAHAEGAPTASLAMSTTKNGPASVVAEDRPTGELSTGVWHRLLARVHGVGRVGAIGKTRAPPALWAIGAIVVVGGATVGARALMRRVARTVPSAVVAFPRTGDAAAKGPPGACAANGDCVRAHDGAPWVCRTGSATCAPLESADCRVLAEPGDVEKPSTVWLGAMFPLRGPDAKTFGEANANAVDLARRELARVPGGLPAHRSGDPPRAIGVVLCDDSADPMRAARHLVDEVGVPAVIGFYRSKEVIDLATSLFIPKEVVALAAINTGSMITGIPHPPGSPRLVWRTTVSTSQAARPVARIVAELLEPKVRANRGVPAAPVLPAVGALDRPLRVALVRPNNVSGMSFLDAFFDAMHVDGKTAFENGSAFRQFVTQDAASSGAPGGQKAEDIVAGLVELEPDVVVYIDGNQFTEQILVPLEERWHGRRHRPYYASAGLLRGDALYRFVGRDASRRRRFFSAEMPATTSANAKLTLRYNETFTPKVSLISAPSTSYDAFYVLAYGAFAVGDAPLTGPSLARAFARLTPPGRPVDVGPTGIFDALAALHEGERIDLNGAGTRLDFDLATGESSTDFVVLCIGVDARGAASESMESGLVFDAATERLRGTLRCP